MDKIFEGAKFGDKFKTRGGKMVIFIRFIVANGIWNCVSNGKEEYFVRDSGLSDLNLPSHYDIVSRWEETIDEKKLDELAEMKNPHYNTDVRSLEYTRWNDGFKAGYRKAKEE